MGEGDGAPNGVGAAVLPNGDADDKPPAAEPNGLLLLVLEAVVPNGDGVGAEALPKGVEVFCVPDDPKGD